MAFAQRIALTRHPPHSECGAPIVFPEFDFDDDEGAGRVASAGLKVNMRLPTDGGQITLRVRSGDSSHTRVQVAVNRGDCIEIGDAIIIRVG